ncbi:HAD family hydrolase [Leptospira jelokensis]|uniref:Haloacid dehalogenase-like hydrolase n=1 Tax=Leptospira jelokensis TaxID=2484931 RepID=A0A4Z1A449_9LEPT|nr:HAD family hydrolase [Leptospira jelokensis]TGL72157.1 haloacid dehalogenase-like hydrolase [Leptospira jelokensis]TGM06131.1 haloacid dehalogenase-like hydrolase [Leptospira jelokensis]
MTQLTKNSWTDEIYERLTSLIPKKTGIACFDFDNTLIRNDFGEKIMDQLIKEGLVFLPKDLSPFFRDKDLWKDHTQLSFAEKEHLVWEEYAYQLKEFGIERGYRWTSFLFQGLTKADYFEVSERAWNLVNQPDKETGVFPQVEMKDLIQYLNHYNWQVYIVTASPEPGISAIAHHFPVKESHVIGMRQALDENNKYTHELIEPYTYGEGKVKAIEERIGEYPDLVFGDSFNDYPMLTKAKEFGVAIDKGDPEFVKVCSSQGILIQPYFAFPTLTK